MIDKIPSLHPVNPVNAVLLLPGARNVEPVQVHWSAERTLPVLCSRGRWRADWSIDYADSTDGGGLTQSAPICEICGQKEASGGCIQCCSIGAPCAEQYQVPHPFQGCGTDSCSPFSTLRSKSEEAPPT